MKEKTIKIETMVKISKGMLKSAKFYWENPQPQKREVKALIRELMAKKKKLPAITAAVQKKYPDFTAKYVKKHFDWNNEKGAAR